MTPPSPPSDQELFEAIQTSVAKEKGLGAWLKSRPTWQRRSIAATAVLGLFGFALLVIPRGDLSAYPKERMTTMVILLLALLAISLYFGLRSLHHPAPPSWFPKLFASSAFIVALVVVLAPLSYAPPNALLDHSKVGVIGLKCLGLGLLLGLPVFGLLKLLDRGGSPGSTCFAAAAAGLTGFLCLHMHCPMVSPLHLFAGHALVVLGFVGLTLTKSR